ncbi:Vacuolar sorting protein 18 [Camellia lanceoleosa]|uniref:Vacuolar sorting protein 18 n=1 Tax=Camellia lanceoleosa TaxID=1840588 RepID=A0ACC0GUQ6_9ERIC|nr:Vacuolar sorting protein 18 [Camellia lanceoleosa]
METHIKWNFILVTEWFSFKENGCCHGISLVQDAHVPIKLSGMGFEENFSFHVTIRRMTVPFFVSCNASLAKDGLAALNSSMIPNMPCAFASRKSGCGLVDPNLLRKFESDKVEDDEDLRKKLWLMVAKHVVEQEKGTKRENIRKAIAFLKETDGLLKIEDILPFFLDFALIDDFKYQIVVLQSIGGDRGSWGGASGGNCMKGREGLGLAGGLGGGTAESRSGGQQGMVSVNCWRGKSRREEEEGR